MNMLFDRLRRAFIKDSFLAVCQYETSDPAINTKLLKSAIKYADLSSVKNMAVTSVDFTEHGEVNDRISGMTMLDAAYPSTIEPRATYALVVEFNDVAMAELYMEVSRKKFELETMSPTSLLYANRNPAFRVGPKSKQFDFSKLEPSLQIKPGA